MRRIGGNHTSLHIHTQRHVWVSRSATASSTSFVSAPNSGRRLSSFLTTKKLLQSFVGALFFPFSPGLYNFLPPHHRQHISRGTPTATGDVYQFALLHPRPVVRPPSPSRPRLSPPPSPCPRPADMGRNVGRSSTSTRPLSKRHYCQLPGCPWLQGFKRDSDRKRHQLSCHNRREGSQKIYHCRAPGCNPFKPWKRLDHLQKHFQRKHADYDQKKLICE